MGQTSSGEHMPEWAEVQKQAANIKEIAMLSYANFLASIKDLNKISQAFTDGSGKRMVFAVKRGTDATMLWKATVKIGCVRVNAETKQIESYRLLNLKQYLQVYRMIICQVDAQNQSSSASGPGRPAKSSPNVETTDSSESEKSLDLDTLKASQLSAMANTPFSVTGLTASMILDKVAGDAEQADSLDECCICMERKPEVILPCAHSYCLPCIEQWNVASNTCPVCREEIENTDDSWVISEAPDSSEMAAEVHKFLSELSDKTEDF